MKKLLLIVLLIGCSTEPKDCAGVAGGTSELDNCNVCDSDSSNDCTQDCAGEWGGDAVSRLMGDVDGDGYITGYCCEDQTSCSGNPILSDEINSPGCGGAPSGDEGYL